MSKGVSRSDTLSVERKSYNAVLPPSQREMSVCPFARLTVPAVLRLVLLLCRTIALIRLLLRVCSAAILSTTASGVSVRLLPLVGPLGPRDVRLAPVGGLLEPIRALTVRLRACSLLVVLGRRVLQRRRRRRGALLLDEGNVVPPGRARIVLDRGVLLLVLGAQVLEQSRDGRARRARTLRRATQVQQATRMKSATAQPPMMMPTCWYSEVSSLQ